MSLIITLHGEEGIVMASDSRLTIDNDQEVDGKKVRHVGASQTSTSYKTFQAGPNVGLSMWGAATIDGIPLSGYIERFINEELVESPVDIDTVPARLIKWSKSLPHVPDTGFHVAGYKVEANKFTQKIWRVFLVGENITEMVPAAQKQGVLWNGEQDILTRLISPKIHFLEQDGKTYTQLPHFGIPFEMFTLQDMIDFAVYAIRTTADTMKFQMRPKSVGDPIDVLVIKPKESFWIQRKTLHV